MSSKVMASFSAFGGDLPSIAFIVIHSLEGSVLWSSVSTNCAEACRENVDLDFDQHCVFQRGCDGQLHQIRFYQPLVIQVFGRSLSIDL